MAVDDTIRRFRIAGPLSGGPYRALIDCAIDRIFNVGLVVRVQLPQSDRLLSVVERLEPGLLTREHVYAWPGTRLAGSTGGADLLVYSPAPSVGEVLKSEADSLWQWRQPEMPEDLCFFRPDGRPFFFSVTHERQAFLDVSASEAVELQQSGVTNLVPAATAARHGPAVPE